MDIGSSVSAVFSGLGSVFRELFNFLNDVSIMGTSWYIWLFYGSLTFLAITFFRRIFGRDDDD